MKFYKKNGELRLKIVEYLLQQGADSMRNGGFSGKRPFEMARQLGYAPVANYIESSELHHKFGEIRQLINKKELPTNLGPLVRKYMDLNWRAETAHWLIQINRHNHGQNFKPHPQLLKVYDGTQASVEEIFKDCQERHKRWWRGLCKEVNNE